MFRLDADLRVYLHREAIDFRFGMTSLITLVAQEMKLDPFARAVFAFRNRRSDRIKLLRYDHTGFWLMLRRCVVILRVATGTSRKLITIHNCP